jgi:hypothetical protein
MIPIFLLLFAGMLVPTFWAFYSGEWRWLLVTALCIMAYRAG